MGQTGQEDKKKVRTESGRYISSSYKNNLYPAMGTAACLGWALQEQGGTCVSIPARAAARAGSTV